MFAAFSPGSDFKRYYRGSVPRLALLVIILMPLLYGAMYLWAFWNPFAAADKMPVALVNSDKGASVQGKPLNAGDQVATGLIDSKQLDLHEVSAEEAADGVADGTYYFSITLPENFSESVASPSTATPTSADLVFTYNDANNYLATVIGQDAALEVVNQVSAQVGQQTFDIVLSAVGGIGSKMQEAADGANELNAGLVTANSGAEELATNLVTAKDGSATLASGLGQLDGAVIAATDPVLSALNRAGGGLSAGEMTSIANRLGTNSSVITQDLVAAANRQSQASHTVSTLLSQMQASSDPNIQALAATLAPAQTFLSTEGLGPDADNQLTAVRNDAQILAAELNNPQSPLRIAMTLFESGGLRNDILAARGAANELSSGADELSSGLVQLSDGANQLAAGTVQLSSGAGQLATGLDEGMKELPTWNDEQKQALAKTLGQPVQLKEEYTNEAPTFGTGFSPFFMSLALFVGGIITWMLLTPLQSRPIVQGLAPLRVVLASYAPAFTIGILQAAILYGVVTFGVGLDAKYPIATFGFLLLVVMMFLAIIQMFNAVFGTAVGRVVTLAFLMLQLVSAGGIYPVQTTATPFQYIHYVDPMTYTVNGLRQLTVGGVDSRLWVALIVIVSVTVVCLLISAWSARRNRQYTMDRLYPPVEV